MLRDSYYLPFSADPPPLTLDPPLLSYSHSHPLFQELTSQVQALLAKGAIEQTDFSPGFYSRLFLALKQNRDWRPVIDLSALNRYLSSLHFCMETVRSVMQSLPLGAWCTSINLKDAFLHVPITRKHRKYLRFRIRGAASQFRALPFGLTTSPLVVTHIVKTVGACAHSQGLNMLLYLDDWNIPAPSPTLCARWTEWVLRLTASLGLTPNLPKCDLTPSQQFVFIGIAFDLNTGTARPAPHRVANFLQLLRDFLSSRAPPAVKWQRLLDHMTSLEKLTRRGRLHTRPVQFTLHDQWSQSSDPPLLPVRITPELLPVLWWWSLSVNLTSGVPLHQPLLDLHLFTDTSSEGWGAHLLLHETGGLWDSVQKHLHINILELLAVRLALQHFLPLVQGQPVMVMTDNTTVVAQLRNRGGTLSRPLYSHTAQLLLWADSHNISLVPHHILGKLNIMADCLSRRHQVLNSEWTLSLPVLHQVWRLWGQPHVNIFATADNACLPTFVSPLSDPRAWRIDAFSFTWTGLWIYLFPPFPLLPEVLRRISLTHCQAILIAPAWFFQPWFPLLLRLLVDLPRQLPPTRTLRVVNCCHGCSTRSPCIRLFMRGIYQVRSPTKGVFSGRGAQNCFSTPPVNTVCLRQQVETFL